MRNALCLTVYRIYFALRDALEGTGRDLPRPLKWGRRALHRVVRRYFLPDVRLNVRIRSGLSQGLWIRARFPGESDYWRGRREASTHEALLASVRAGAVVYDIGAHIGTVALGSARLVGETGRVVAFEADPDTVASLRASARRNRLEARIQVVQAAVWSSTSPAISFRRGSTRLSHGGVDAGGLAPSWADGPSITVPAITLDHFVNSGGPPPGLIKIDVEGGEFEVLRGASTLISRNRPLIIVEVHHWEAFRQISEWMEEFFYQGKWSVPGPGFPRLLFAWPAESPTRR